MVFTILDNYQSPEQPTKDDPDPKLKATLPDLDQAI